MNPIRRFVRSHRLGAGLALWLVAEIVLRVFQVPFHIAWIPEWPAYDVVAMSVVLGLKGPYRMPGGWTMSAHTGFYPVRANRFGESRIQLGPGPRILCLGGSTTLGVGVNDGETYPAQLENVLDASRPVGPPFQVINAAWTGTTSYFGAVTLVEYLDRFRPTVVVIGWGGVNDSMRVHFRETRVRHFSPLLRALRSSSVYRLGESSLFRLCLYPELVSRVSDDEYRGHLRAMHDTLRQRGIGAVFLTESLNPARNWSQIDLLSPYDVARKARIMVEEGRALGVPVVDVVPLVNRGTGGYVDDDVHWSPAGNARIAKAVAQAVHQALAARNASTGSSAEPGL